MANLDLEGTGIQTFDCEGSPHKYSFELHVGEDDRKDETVEFICIVMAYSQLIEKRKPAESKVIIEFIMEYYPKSVLVAMAVAGGV